MQPTLTMEEWRTIHAIHAGRLPPKDDMKLVYSPACLTDYLYNTTQCEFLQFMPMLGCLAWLWYSKYHKGVLEVSYGSCNLNQVDQYWFYIILIWVNGYFPSGLPNDSFCKRNPWFSNLEKILMQAIRQGSALSLQHNGIGGKLPNEF